ncbi:hemerythrin superfamily protein [Paraburkholderia sp. GAS199]|uniref:hemerythrin domain-containing protein n=1 Tax=Paraburkholderia sp. GAS199 TaxID=3035126 RepID=UPI003D1E4FBE
MKSENKVSQQENVSTRQAAPASKDALSILVADHRTVQGLFDAFKRAGDDDLDRKGTLVRRACEELSIHTILEEELLYPAAQEALDEDQRPDVEEAYVEHYLVKVLIDKFTTLKPGDKGFDATFKVLTEMVNHHIEEEESELFPELRKSKADLETLGAEIEKRKTALEAKLSKDVGDRTTRLH